MALTALDQFTGLTAAEVADRVSRGLVNHTPARSSRTYGEIARDNVLNVFTITVAVLLAILLALGEVGDTVFAGLTVALNTLIGVVQEVRAKWALDRLAALAAGTVRVRRDGQTLAIPLDQVVQDDVIEVSVGDKIVVDGPCLWEDAVELDESLVTGESDSIVKDAGDPLTSGSFVTAGRGLMRAEKVGAESYANRLGQTARGFRIANTPIQQKINAIVSVSVLGMAIFGPLLLVQGWSQGEPLRETIRAAVVLVTTFVPQGVVLATTLALTFGAVRISQQQALVQRINAIESMGNVTVLCFDKTGTLTENRLSVQEIVPIEPCTEAEAKVLLAQYVGSLSTANKTAAAIAAYTGPAANPPAKVAEVAFTSTRKWGSATFAGGQTFLLGAPEILIDEEALLARAAAVAGQGLRVLVFMSAPTAPVEAELPPARRALAFIVVQDTLRADIQETLHGFAVRGIRVKVISGDSADTVAALARAAGVPVEHSVTERELAHLPPAEFAAAVRDADVFARITPDMKRRIVGALTAQDEYVAMVGDGVNDVPALKAARLSIAMHDGAQMAKDVADMVLLNNALSTLLNALHEGTATTQKIFATVKMFLTKNLYTVLTIILVGFMGLPFPGQVRQLTWVTLCTASIPSLMVTFNLIRPRPVRRFQRQVLGYIMIASVIGGVSCTGAYTAAYFASGNNVDIARSVMTIVASLFGVLVFWDVHGVVPFEPVTFKQNRREATIGVIVMLIALVVPLFFPRPFQIEVLPWPYWAGILALATVDGFLLWRSNLQQTRVLDPIRALMAR